MSIQSITANTQPAPLLQATGKAVAQPELKAGSQSTEAAKKSEIKPEATSLTRQDEERQVQEAVDNLQKFVSQMTNDITFSIEEDVGIIVKVIDRESQDVIRQIPSEEVVAIARALDKLQGLFVRDKI